MDKNTVFCSSTSESSETPTHIYSTVKEATMHLSPLQRTQIRSLQRVTDSSTVLIYAISLCSKGNYFGHCMLHVYEF